MPYAATWMDLEIIVLSELSQKEKDKYHMISFVCGIWNTLTQWTWVWGNSRRKWRTGILQFMGSQCVCPACHLSDPGKEFFLSPISPLNNVSNDLLRSLKTKTITTSHITEHRLHSWGNSKKCYLFFVQSSTVVEIAKILGNDF